MASFNGLILTQAGANLQDKIAVNGATLQFTRAAIGDGLWPAGLDPTGLTGLISEKKSLAIQGLTDEGTGQHKISVLMDNAGLETGFMTRELGVFADDPDLGEILYQVTNADNPDYLPPGGGATHIEMALDLIVVTSSAASVTAVINEALVYASKKDVTAARDSFKGFELNGRHTLYAGDLDVIERNSLYAVQQGQAAHLPEDLPVNAWAFCQTMILPGDAGRTQFVWSVDDPEHAGWWRKRAAGTWSDWRPVEGNDSLPAGTCVDWAVDLPPSGFLVRNGAYYNAADYPDLHAIIGYRYGRSDNQFRVPDDRGKVTRYMDLGRGMDPDTATRFMRRTGTTVSGSTVITALNGTEPFAVGLSISGSGIPAGSTIVSIDSASQLTISAAATVNAAGVELKIVVGDLVGSEQDDEFKSHAHQYYQEGGSGGSNIGGDYSGGGLRATSAAGGNETRAKNTSKLPLIKY